jgi:hypothetical protein
MPTTRIAPTRITTMALLKAGRCNKRQFNNQMGRTRGEREVEAAVFEGGNGQWHLTVDGLNSWNVLSREYNGRFSK